MRWAALALLAATLSSAPARAASAPQAAPELVRLDRELTDIEIQAAPDSLLRFRAELDAAMIGAVPSPANAALYSRILARLGRALEQAPENMALRTALSQVRFDQKNYPAALAEADAVLARDPLNKEALTLKHFSEGRAAMNVDAADHSSPALPARRFHFSAPVKLARAAAPPELIARGAAPAAPGPFPLLPLAGAAALGLAAYEISRSRAAYESADGLDDEHPKPVGRLQRLVAGAILAGAAVAVSAAPVALGYATNVGMKTTNELPKVFARVIAYEPGTTIPETIGRTDQAHAFVTAAEDIAGFNAAQIPQRLGIAPSAQYLVIRFPVPLVGISSPLTFDHPLFVGGGLTAGGAREYFIANDLIPTMATYELLK